MKLINILKRFVNDFPPKGLHAKLQQKNSYLSYECNVSLPRMWKYDAMDPQNQAFVVFVELDTLSQWTRENVNVEGTVQDG